MNITVEMKNGDKKVITTGLSFKEKVKWINDHQVLMDDDGLPIDLNKVKQLHPERR